MGLNIATGFSVGAQVPIDDRFVVADVTAITSSKRYVGLIAYQTGTSSAGGPGNYQLVGGLLDGNWIALGAVQRVVPLSQALTVSSGEITPNSLYDAGYLASLTVPLTINAPSGSPFDFQKYLLRIKSAASQGLTFNSIYRAGSQFAIPTATTGSGKTDYYGFMWNAVDSKWDYTGRSTGH